MKSFYAVLILFALAAISHANQSQPSSTAQACELKKPEIIASDAFSEKQALSKFLREIFDAKSDKEQSDIWLKYQNYRKKFPKTLTAKDKNSGKIMRFFNNGDTFDCGTDEELPTKISIPKRKTILSKIPSSYQIRYRFDADKDDELSDTEMFKLLIELHYILQKAATNQDRELLIERYANAITSQEFANEFSITWGKDSSFRIVKNPATGRWSAPDEAPIKRHAIGSHPSQTIFQEKIKDEKYFMGAMKILSRTNPFLRAEKIEELLNSDFEIEEINSKQPMLIEFVEYINEKSELASIPVFKTDPLKTTQMLSDFSKENASRFTESELAEYKNYKKSE